MKRTIIHLPAFGSFGRKSLAVALLLLSAAWPSVVHSQSTADSLAIASVQWKTSRPHKGIVCHTAHFPQLYKGAQSVCWIRIDPREGWMADVAVSAPPQTTSEAARAHNATAAINGSYFDMIRGKSICFLKKGRQVIDTTSAGELQMRVNGAICIKRGKMQILAWNKTIEKKHHRGKRTVLASGPLLLHKGEYCNWQTCDSSFVHTKHPRSAIALTKEEEILLLAVDGRFPGKAIGMSLPELAHLLKMLGAREALNLDGGGSTTLWTSCGVCNHPCDNKRFDNGGERKVPNTVYIHKKR